MFQESALDNGFHVCVVKSHHYRTTGEMPQMNVTHICLASLFKTRWT